VLYYGVLARAAWRAAVGGPVVSPAPRMGGRRVARSHRTSMNATRLRCRAAARTNKEQKQPRRSRYRGCCAPACQATRRRRSGRCARSTAARRATRPAAETAGTPWRCRTCTSRDDRWDRVQQPGPEDQSVAQERLQREHGEGVRRDRHRDDDLGVQPADVSGAGQFVSVDGGSADAGRHRDAVFRERHARDDLPAHGIDADVHRHSFGCCAGPVGANSGM
jgi:hypothetical protein